ncbi:EamA-like transporter family protein [Chitinophaga oryziterrae]|uniref:EamA-like transporter family protein n=1 Tax=Chitinophaga oryziterrae TaxID=1031224 RepID=A0A6N8JCB1_9BACT|nr:DMT family transporter [Chitinophaga oryziterrae]MVT42850.1 EamA-like transporter family protein [Chitinophaga oryziterrae]
MKIAWLFVVFLCGALLPLQGGLNAKLAKSIGSPIYASMICFIVGALAMGLYVPFTKETFSWQLLKGSYITAVLGGGVIGAVFITGSMLALPRLGMALTFGLVIAGQVIISVLLDHFSILVAAQHPINIWRGLGMLLIIAGVAIVEKF